MAAPKRCRECGRLVIKISWSSLRTHETCRQRGYLQRQGKRGSLSDQRIFFPGNVTDRIVRYWLENDPLSHMGEMPDMVATFIDKTKIEMEAEGPMRWRNPTDRSDVHRGVEDALRKIEPSLLERVVPYRYTPDFSFDAPLSLPHPAGGQEQVRIIGRMDILVQDDKDQFWVYDVKHTTDDSYWKKTVAQLTFYDLSVRMLFGKKTTGVALLQPLCRERVKEFVISDDWRRQMLQRISAMAGDIWRGDNSPRRDFDECHFCNVKHACRKFNPLMQAGARSAETPSGVL